MRLRTHLPLAFVWTAVSAFTLSCGSDPASFGNPADVFDPNAEAPPNTCITRGESSLAHARLPEGYCAWVFAAGVNQPRGITRAQNGDLLVVERGASRVLALFDTDGDGISAADERAVLAEVNNGPNDRLNHGITVAGDFLYASTATRVYRWPFPSGTRAALGEPQVVVTGIPSGGHNTRSLAVDGEGRLYVSVGSASNVDSDSSRSRIRRFSAAQVEAGNVPFEDGELFADGLRNEVGLAFDSSGVLWGVENGRDDLERADLGGDIHNDNPGEELNRFADAGRFYGYPYCWSEFLLPAGVGQGPGTQWADPTFMDDGVHTDAWCRNTANVVPPALVLPAHTAPLGITFYTGNSFPEETHGDAFVALHGSWNREPPQGYQVTRVLFDETGPTGYEPFLEFDSSDDSGNDWPHRPVDVEVGARGELYVTSDASDLVIGLGYTR